jgi:hypothetical protein
VPRGTPGDDTESFVVLVEDVHDDAGAVAGEPFGERYQRTVTPCSSGNVSASTP